MVGPSPARVGPSGLRRVWRLKPPVYECQYRGHLEAHKAGRPLLAGRGRKSHPVEAGLVDPGSAGRG